MAAGSLSFWTVLLKREALEVRLKKVAGHEFLGCTCTCTTGRWTFIAHAGKPEEAICMTREFTAGVINISFAEGHCLHLHGTHHPERQVMHEGDGTHCLRLGLD